MRGSRIRDRVNLRVLRRHQARARLDHRSLSDGRRRLSIGLGFKGRRDILGAVVGRGVRGIGVRFRRCRLFGRRVGIRLRRFQRLLGRRQTRRIAGIGARGSNRGLRRRKVAARTRR